MAIHPGIQFSFSKERTIGSLVLPQILEGLGNFRAIRSVEVRIARTQKRQNRESCDASIGLSPRTLAIVTEDSAFLTRTELRSIPAAVGRLISGQPSERRFHRSFCLRTTATFCRQFSEIFGKAIRVEFGNWLRLVSVDGWRLENSSVVRHLRTTRQQVPQPWPGVEQHPRCLCQALAS